MKTHRAFKSDPNPLSCVVYLPKHTSWLNPLEYWFSLLTRRLLKRGELPFTDALSEPIFKFIDYFKRTPSNYLHGNLKGENTLNKLVIYFLTFALNML